MSNFAPPAFFGYNCVKGNEMASMIISNMPEELHRRLERAAQKDGRTADEEAIVILERALRPVPPVSLPKPIVPLRPISAEEIMEGIREGRE